LQSCISMGPLTAARGLAEQTAAAAVVAGVAVVATEEAGVLPTAKQAKEEGGCSRCRSTTKNSHRPRTAAAQVMLALAATPIPQRVSPSSTALVGAEAKAALEWLGGS
jgi:hypothetical protein